MRAFCSWSGGKDSALALYRAINNQDIEVPFFLNMINDDGKYSRSHGIPIKVLQAQVEAMGLTLLQQPATWDDYEEKFKEAVISLKQQGVNTGIFGDIDLEPHREWVERVCQEMGITPILPLWLGQREDLILEFIDAGFQAMVTAVNCSFMGKEWLGRMIDHKFIADIKDKGNIDLCGENGEYHTLVLDGPIFNQRLNIIKYEPVGIENHFFLNITDCKKVRK